MHWRRALQSMVTIETVKFGNVIITNGGSAEDIRSRKAQIKILLSTRSDGVRR